MEPTTGIFVSITDEFFKECPDNEWTLPESMDLLISQIASTEQLIGLLFSYASFKCYAMLGILLENNERLMVSLQSTCSELRYFPLAANNNNASHP